MTLFTRHVSNSQSLSLGFSLRLDHEQHFPFLFIPTLKLTHNRKKMAIVEEIPETVPTPAAAPAGTETTGEGIEPFLGLSREQCHILLALYHVVDPSLEPNVPVLFPTMAEKFAEDRKERNTLVKKLERTDEKYSQEVLNLQEIQKAVFVALMEADMDTEKAREFLKMKPRTTPMEELTIQEVLSNGFLMGGVRDDSKNPETADKKKKSSPVASPNFLEAKAYYDYAFDKFGFTMAAVQLGSFYYHEFKECQGENCQEGEDPETLSLDYYMKAAVSGNPMAMHKVAWHYDQKGEWHKAIEWYTKAADQGKSYDIDVGGVF